MPLRPDCEWPINALEDVENVASLNRNDQTL